MNRAQLFKGLAYLIFAISVLHFLAQKFHWYFSLWWFDMPMHFLGGLWLGLFFIYWFSFKEPSFRYIMGLLSFVFIIGMFWEFFELYFINYVGQNSFSLLDTISDLFFDLSGGLCAMLYLWKKQLK